jgi:DNA (cytosine-5)-methyltransferase 1
MDNSGDSFATVLILMEGGQPVIMRNREGCAGGGKGPMYSDKSFTLATSNDQILIIDGTRVGDVRVSEDTVMQTVIQRWGTGGGNVPMVFSHTQGLDIQASEENSPTLRTQGGGMAVAYSIREDAQANTFSATELEVANALQAHQPSVQSHHAQTFVAEDVQIRRLTPVECERLQGFPDNWTDGQADSSRYKQMGNAVAVPVVEWIISRLV